MKKTIAFVSALIAFALFAVTACAHEAKSTVKHNPQYTKWDIFEPPDNTSVGSWTCHSAAMMNICCFFSTETLRPMSKLYLTG